MRRRGFRGRDRGGSNGLLKRLRDRPELGLRELRSLDRLPGSPDGLEVGVGRREGDDRALVVASSSESPALLGWGAVGMLFAGGGSPFSEMIVAAPVIGSRTRQVAARLRGTLPPVRLIAIPALAESPEELHAEEFFPPSSDALPRIAPARGLLDRVVRIIEGATALTGVGELRSTPPGFVLYVRGVLVLEMEPQGEGIALTFLEPDRRQIHIRETNLPRWGVDLYEHVVQLAQDPRLIDRADAPTDATVHAIAARSGVRVTGRSLPWSREGRQPIEWVGVDDGGRPVLGLCRRGVGLQTVPAVVGAWAALAEEGDLWTPGATGPIRVVVSCREYDPRFESALGALGIEAERVAEEQAATEVPRPPLERERRGRRRSRRRRRVRGDVGAPLTAESGEGASEIADTGDAEPEEETLQAEEEVEGLDERAEAEPEPEPMEIEPSEVGSEAIEVPEALEPPGAVETGEGEEDEADEAEGDLVEEPLAAATAASPEEDAEVALEKAPARIRRPRAAIVVRNDVDSVLAGLVLARDRRNIVLFWVCAQDRLMDFFKTAATDLADNVDICLVGFTAQPVPKEVLQTAEIYRGRIQWLDHHPWPVEDLELLRQAVGEDAIVIPEGVAGSLAAVMRVTERRSRFTDKLIDLWAHRLSENDMRKWGYRVAALLRALAAASGDRRQEIVPVLTGKPSALPEREDLYAEEEAWLGAHPPRVVHFGDYQMAVIHVPEHLDGPEIARRARLMAGCRISLLSCDGQEIVTIVANEEKRQINLQGMADHLAAHLPWLEPRPGGDRSLRLWVDDLPRHPERLELLVGEIARNKSVLYG